MPVGLCVWFLGVGLWMIRSMVLHRGRPAGIERVARAAGMRFSERDGHGVSRTSFEHFSSGAGRGWTATNVVTSCGRDGLLAHAFDARSRSEYDAIENVASKLFAAAARLDLDVESEMFNRCHHVIGESRDFARSLLDARIVDLTTRTGGRISFELVGSKALLVADRVEPELIPAA